MNVLPKLPIRVRLTLAFAVGVGVILAGVGTFVHARMGADLLAATDASLGAQADALEAAVRAPGSTLGLGFGARGTETESFAQLADESGAILESAPAVAQVSLLPPSFLRSVTGRTYVDRRIVGVDNVARLLADPLTDSGRRFVLIVGTSLQDRRDALLQLAALLGIGGPVALALTSLAAWFLAGALLRPVEQMRREADAISLSEPARRLPVTGRRDEMARLGRTLNSMLERLGESFERERRFLDDASHELRTPLSVLKGELELALRHDREPEELRATLALAAEETDRLVRLAEDLLVLSRTNRGRLEVHRRDTGIRTLVDEASERHRSRAEAAGVGIEVEAIDGQVAVDPMRVRQALDNLLDNALRHAPGGSVVRIGVARRGGEVRLVVEDSGPGFPPELLARAFEPFSTGPDPDRNGNGGAGLGLAIVQAIAEGHGGRAVAENRAEGGSRLSVILPET
jgi:two-component system, OmpR family, sensor kinase